MVIPRALLLVVPVCVLLVGAGCSSKKSAATTRTTAAPAVMPRAATADVWANRIVDLLLRSLQQDLVVVSQFDNPQTRIYIQTGNDVAIRTIRRRMTDLSQCSTKLTAIGPPPHGRAPLAQVGKHLARACTAYVDVAQKLLKATQMLSSGRRDVVEQGDRIAAEARVPSRRAALELTAAIKIAQRQPSFRRAGLKPSV
jgi:hypothetical protein